MHMEPLALNPFTLEETKRKLQRCENSAPDHDRLTYDNWREADPDCQILTAVFNTCLKYKKIPATSKTNRTILIPKPGNRDALCNWRPIALSSTIYKLYAGLI